MSPTQNHEPKLLHMALSLLFVVVVVLAVCINWQRASTKAQRLRWILVANSNVETGDQLTGADVRGKLGLRAVDDKQDKEFLSHKEAVVGQFVKGNVSYDHLFKPGLLSSRPVTSHTANTIMLPVMVKRDRAILLQPGEKILFIQKNRTISILLPKNKKGLKILSVYDSAIDKTLSVVLVEVSRSDLESVTPLCDGTWIPILL